MATLPLDPEDPRTVGPYTVRARLGEGGMGVVYLADGPAGRVALKVVRRLLAGDETFRARFRREVAAARRVEGRGVARLLDADTEGNRPWLAMTYVEGPTLMDAVVANGPLTGDRLRALSVALAEAVATIHRAGVTHRDLKPTNVLLAEDQPVVVDFGVASATEATSITVVGTVMGSPGWMAPEQVTGSSPSPAMDVFAWGTLVTWAATGNNPFGTGRPEAVAYRILHDEPDLSGLPDDLVPVVTAALDKDPARRPDADRLLSWLLDRPEPAPAEALADDATALLARTWAQTPLLSPAPLPPPAAPPPGAPHPVTHPPAAAVAHPAPAPRRRSRAGGAALVVVVLLVSAAVGVAIGVGLQEYRDRQDAAGTTPAPDPTTTTTTTTTIPTVALQVRWVVADDAFRDVGTSCEAAAPHDSSATLEVRDGAGASLAEPVEVGQGTAELGTGVIDDVLGFTSCVYTLDFEAVPEADTYVLVPSTGEPEVTFAAAELEAADWRAEIVSNTGI